MGQAVKQHDFTESQQRDFSLRLESQLQALREELCRDCYDEPVVSFGAELEMYLVDEHFSPIAINEQILKRARSSCLQEELNQYILEANLTPVNATQTPFTALQKEMEKTLQAVSSATRIDDAHPMTIGILPTLQPKHVSGEYLTNRPRYKALAQQLAASRGKPFSINISGLDSLILETDNITLEGANTSFQVHHRVANSRFAQCYNAAQLTTPLVLALSGNSPFFLGKRLWQETRIALFKQAIDERLPTLSWQHPARVNYGHGWVRQGIEELLAQSVALYPPLLPVTAEQSQKPNDPFFELNVHLGTVWHWNRAIFEPGEHGHVRIEYRSLPAGPTPVDMLANAALQIGLTEALSHHIEAYLQKLPFNYCEFNFYRCAQKGLNAKILWPQRNQHGLCEMPVTDVLSDILPLAAEGLTQIGVPKNEIDFYLDVIAHRLASQQTGAVWQQQKYAQLRQHLDIDDAMMSLTRQYHQQALTQQPVAQWE